MSLVSSSHSPPYREGLGVGLFSLFRNHLRRFYLQDLVEVVTDDKDDDEGGEHECAEDGEGGGQ